MGTSYRLTIAFVGVTLTSLAMAVPVTEQAAQLDLTSEALVLTSGQFACPVGMVDANIVVEYIPPGDYRITIWGQSNALGVAARSGLSASPLNSDSGLATFDGAAFSRVRIWDRGASAYVALENGVNNAAFTSSDFGPEFAMAVRWMRETDAGTLYIDKKAADGSAIINFLGGNAFFTDFAAERSAGDAWLSSNAVTVTDSGFLWVQGESDYLDSEATYRLKLDELIADRIAASLQASDELVVLAQVNSGNNFYGSGVDAAKAAYVVTNPTTSVAIDYLNALNGDNVHLNARGQVQLGYDAFEQMFGVPHISV